MLSGAVVAFGMGDLALAYPAQLICPLIQSRGCHFNSFSTPVNVVSTSRVSMVWGDGHEAWAARLSTPTLLSGVVNVLQWVCWGCLKSYPW